MYVYIYIHSFLYELYLFQSVVSDWQTAKKAK